MSEKKELLKKLTNKELEPIELSSFQLHALTKERKYDNYGSLMIKTQHKTFDENTDDICIGYSDLKTCYSDYVRPFNLLDDGHEKTNVFGQLFEQDLEVFAKFDGFIDLRNTLLALDSDTTYIVYALFHYFGKKMYMHGFVITDENYQFARNVQIGTTFKSKFVLDEVRKYVSFDLLQA